DPVADMLTRVRNANIAMHDDVRMPSSKLKEALAAILHKEGYIESFAVADDPTRPGRVLTITMKYSTERARTISGLRRVSKPGLRIYIKADKVPRVLGGLGVAVLSTSKGLMTDREARKAGVGGEILCFVW
ncbi:MAG: 30S ribosomal protein S8, partial [Actinomycetota bacterium]|nr:30S ribosomal protein S8 [Actinomycetota bacterium]